MSETVSIFDLRRVIKDLKKYLPWKNLKIGNREIPYYGLGGTENVFR
jgi:hypothetical protein